MLGGAVHQQRFKRAEEMACRNAVAFFSLDVAAELGAQRLHDRSGAGDFRAGKLQPLELVQQVAAGRWRQSLQEFLEMVLNHCKMVVTGLEPLLVAGKALPNNQSRAS